MDKGEVFKFRIGRTCFLSQSNTQNLRDLFNLFSKAKTDFPWLSLEKVNVDNFRYYTTDMVRIYFEVDEGILIPGDYKETVSLREIYE